MTRLLLAVLATLALGGGRHRVRGRLHRDLKFKLKAPSGARIVSATVKVNGKTKARLKGAKVHSAISLKKLKRTTRVKVTLKLAGGRKLTASRAYRACR